MKNGVPQAAPAAKKKEKVTLRKKESKTSFVHPWLACNLKGHSGSVLGLDFSSNGKYLASCSEGMDGLCTGFSFSGAFHIALTLCIVIVRFGCHCSGTESVTALIYSGRNRADQTQDICIC